MQATGLVPVFYHPDAQVACRVVKACYDGGVRAFELTNRGDFAHEVFAQVMRFAATECPELALGVGTVVDPATAALYIQQGACFVVGPLFNPEVAKVCNRRLIPYSPGCATATEVGMAQEMGCDLTKIFPGDVYGPRLVQDIMAPMPWSRLMVTGGVDLTQESLASWMQAGAFCVGMGSKLFPASLIQAADWEGISRRCREALDHLAQARRQ